MGPGWFPGIPGTLSRPAAPYGSWVGDGEGDAARWGWKWGYPPVFLIAEAGWDLWSVWFDLVVGVGVG